MKSLVSTLAMLLFLTGCATAPRPAQVLEVCPIPPILELDAPALDYQGLIASFLSGSVERPLGLKLLSTPALQPMMRLDAR